MNLRLVVILMLFTLLGGVVSQSLMNSAFAQNYIQADESPRKEAKKQSQKTKGELEFEMKKTKAEMQSILEKAKAEAKELIEKKKTDAKTGENSTSNSGLDKVEARKIAKEAIKEADMEKNYSLNKTKHELEKARLAIEKAKAEAKAAKEKTNMETKLALQKMVEKTKSAKAKSETDAKDVEEKIKAAKQAIAEKIKNAKK